MAGDSVYSGTQGPQGPTGPQGPQGPAGNDGVGVPAGGTTGQVLEKIDGTDYNTQWATPSGGGKGFDEYADKTTLESTTSSTLQTYLTLNFTTTTTNQQFDLYVNFIWRQSSTSYDHVGEVHLDDSLINVGFKAQQEPQDSGSNQRYPSSFMGRITVPSAGAHTIKFKYAEASGGTAYTYYASIGMYNV